MNFASRRTIVGVMAMSAFLLGFASLAGGQTAPAPKAATAAPKAASQAPPASGPKVQMAEDVFKNVTVLKGIPVSEFMQTMGFFSGSLGESCEFCHSAESSGSWPHYADDTPLKVTTRKMVLMMNAINKTNFAGRREVTCYSCHRGGQRPEVTPNLAQVYAAGLSEAPEPDIILQGPKTPTPDQILDKYIQAIGGAAKVNGVTSLVGKGDVHPYVGEPNAYPIELFAKAPTERALIIHGVSGDTTTTYDGRDGWTAAPITDRPVTLMPLIKADLDGASVDANLLFPAHIKQALAEWRVGFPITIDDRKVSVLQGTTASRSHVKLYFDQETGLLVRQARTSDSAVGLIPLQIDYSDYREVNGVKIPFQWTTTWLDGRQAYALTDVKANVAVDAAKFAKPPAPAAEPATP